MTNNINTTCDLGCVVWSFEFNNIWAMGRMDMILWYVGVGHTVWSAMQNPKP